MKMSGQDSCVHMRLYQYLTPPRAATSVSHQLMPSRSGCWTRRTGFLLSTGLNVFTVSRRSMPALSAARGSAISCQHVGGQPPLSGTNILIFLKIVASAFYLHKYHKLCPLGHCPYQPSVFRLETAGLRIDREISALHFTWFSGMCHVGVPKPAYTFCDWLFLALILPIKGRALCQTATARVQ